MSMKKSIIALSLMACLTVSLLSGCGTAVPNAEEAIASQVDGSIPTDAVEATEIIRVREATDDSNIQQELQLCREVVEKAQSYEAIQIDSERQNRGKNVLNNTASITYYQMGENEYHSSFIPMDGILDGVPVWGSSFTTLKIGDQYFNYDPDGYVVAKETGYEDHFGKSTLSQEQNEKSYIKPWLLRFHWDDSKISYISTVESGDNKAIRMQVSESFYEDVEGENYTAEFFFENGEFDRVELVANYSVSWETMAGDKGADRHGVTDTERIKDTETKRIEGFFTYMYETAMEDVKNKPKA